MKKVTLALVSLAGLSLAVLALAQSSLPPAVERGQAAITPELLRAHTAFLADDLLEGRAPASRGSELAAKYIAAQYERLGLKPVGDNGTYFQNVPLVGKKVDPAAKLAVSGGGQALAFNFSDDFVPGSDSDESRVPVAGELVFVGYGIVAPEFKWDDFKGADLKGKILVMLVNDPPAPPAEPELFGGRALTYYGRWTYKYESAARQGAAGVLLIHTPESAGYSFAVVQASWSGERFSLPRAAGEPGLGVKAWISQPTAEKILSLAGHPEVSGLAALQRAAASRDFRPVPLGLKASTELQQTVRRIASPNVIGLLEGSDPRLKNEYVIYTAHHDHLGVGKPVDGDAIYNGASDNALGVAHLLAIAEAMARLPEKPKRSQVFLAVTAEEAGLLGSEYYAHHPVFAPAATAANLNMDGLKTWGPTRDVVQVGAGKSELDEVARAVARDHGLTVKPDQSPEQGFFYRSDQFNLAKVGIPALYLDNGEEIVGQPDGYGEQKEKEYRARNYHQPSDEIQPDWDWRGAEQMARFLFALGWRLADSDRDFAWYPTAEFRAARLASQKKAAAGKP